MARDELVREQATAWAVRTGDPGFADWEAFTSWLEQDSGHAQAYDEVMAAVLDAAEAIPAVPPALNDDALNDDEPRRWTRRRWIGGGMTLALAAVMAFGAWQLRGGTYVIETAPGQMRVVELDGGGQIAIAGESRLVLDRGDPRSASLEQGQALFTIAHDAAAPFTLKVGEDRIVDVGTVFDVTHTASGLRVAVSEGAVVLNPHAQNAKVLPGQSLTKLAGEDRFVLAAVPLAEVGEWHEGRLTFQDATLADVAADLSRATGTAFVVASRGPTQRVSGSLVLEGARRDPRTVGPLLGVTVRHNGTAWEIGAQ